MSILTYDLEDMLIGNVTRNEVLDFVKRDGTNIRYVQPHFKRDPEVVKEALNSTGASIFNLQDNLMYFSRYAARTSTSQVRLVVYNYLDKQYGPFKKNLQIALLGKLPLQSVASGAFRLCFDMTFHFK
jgi:hypothetical protein